jgi:hypothetical protein
VRSNEQGGSGALQLDEQEAPGIFSAAEKPFDLEHLDNRLSEGLSSNVIH